MFTKDFLLREYIKLGKSTSKIAQENGCSGWKVRAWLKKHEIPVRTRGGRYRSIDLTGKTFGELTVLKQVKGDGHSAIWLCKCSCGKKKKIKGPYLRRCEIKSCGSCLEHYAWKGHGKISGQFFSSIKNNANRRKIEFDISIEEIWDLFLKQSSMCALSGVKLKWPRSYKSNNGTRTASLDRIDSSKGYTLNNVQWVHKDINRMKREYHQDIFLWWVKKIYENRHKCVGEKHEN